MLKITRHVNSNITSTNSPMYFSYGSGYDGLGQQGNKDFTSNYSSNGQSKSTGGSAAAGTGKGEVLLMHLKSS